MKLIYQVIRLWAPPDVCNNPEKPHYVARVEQEDGTGRWTLTREFSGANYFKNRLTAERVVKGVRRISQRLADRWLFEIIEFTEEVIGTNVPEKKKESA